MSNQISDDQKEQIAKDLQSYVDNVAGGSANKASKILQGVSGGYISLVLNNKWEKIADSAWLNIQKQVCKSSDWVIAPTRGYKMLTQCFNDARLHANTFGIIGDAGFGKTCTADQLNAPNVFILKANEYFTSRNFLEELLRLMGKNGAGYSVTQMMNLIIDSLLRMEHPLIIIDEADKLTDKVLYFFISLYNALEGKCGLIIIATPYLRKKIDDGRLRNKKGYAEIYSRIGRRFLEVPKPNKNDIKTIVNANGIHDPEIVQSIFNNCGFDIRSVKLLVHAYTQKTS